MMNCFVVWIQAQHCGRWVDGIYIDRETADERVEQLKQSLIAVGLTVDKVHHWPWVQTAVIEDAVLGRKKAEQKP